MLALFIFVILRRSQPRNRALSHAVAAREFRERSTLRPSSASLGLLRRRQFRRSAHICCPRFCARLRPSAVRVRIRSRSTSAKPRSCNVLWARSTRALAWLRIGVKVKKMGKAKMLREGTEEWANTLKENAGEHLIALHDILCADLFINRLFDGWDTLDPVIQAALFRSAITVYARPFIKNKRRSKKQFQFRVSELKNVPGFDRELHEHICTLRHTLIAHHDTSVVNAQIGHMQIQPEEGRASLALQTYGMAKALHAIAKRDIVERYLKHVGACKTYFHKGTHEALEQLHMMRVKYPDLAVTKIKSLSIELEKLGDRRFRLPHIEAISRMSPITTPKLYSLCGLLYMA
jgi:hypothetical protein